jgi:hypothetical protein
MSGDVHKALRLLDFAANTASRFLHSKFSRWQQSVQIVHVMHLTYAAVRRARFNRMEEYDHG